MIKKLYRVNKGRGISSQKYQRDFLEDDVIDLSFAHAQEISDLIATGAVTELTPQEVNEYTAAEDQAEENTTGDSETKTDKEEETVEPPTKRSKVNNA